MPTVLGRNKGFPKGRADWDGLRLVRTYTDSYKVEADNEDQGPLTIILALNVLIGEPFFDDPFAFAKTVGEAVREEGNRLIWNVPIFYTTQFPQVDADEVAADVAPEDRRLKRRWSFETLNEVFTGDAITADEPAINSLGEPIEVTHDIVIPVLTVEKWAIDFAAQEILDYVNHVNAAAFYGAPAKTALMAGIEAEEDSGEVYQGVQYDRVRYVIKFKIPITESSKGWLMRVADQSTMHRDPDDNLNFVPYLSDVSATDGVRSQITGKLDGIGFKLPDGDPLFYLPDGTGFNQFKTANFDTLAIGASD